MRIGKRTRSEVDLRGFIENILIILFKELNIYSSGYIYHHHGGYSIAIHSRGNKIYLNCVKSNSYVFSWPA